MGEDCTIRRQVTICLERDLVDPANAETIYHFGPQARSATLNLFPSVQIEVFTAMSSQLVSVHALHLNELYNALATSPRVVRLVQFLEVRLSYVLATSSGWQSFAQ